MQRRDFLAFSSPPQGLGTDIRKDTRLIQSHPSFRLLALRRVSGDLPAVPGCGHRLLRPKVAATGPFTILRQVSSDQTVWKDSGEHFNRLDRGSWSMATVLASTTSGNRQFGVNTAFPVNHQLNGTSTRINVRQNLFDHGSEDALLESNVGVGMVPELFQFSGQHHQFLLRRQFRFSALSLLFLDPRLQLAESLQSLIPPTFQFIGDQPVFWIHCVKLLLCMLCGVAGRFKLQLQGLEDLRFLTGLSLSVEQGRFDGGGLHNL